MQMYHHVVIRSDHRAPARARAMTAAVRLSHQEAGTTVTTVEVDPAEPVLAGHFPGLPILPGICLVECAQQTALLAFADRGEPTSLTAIESTRFLAPVFAGDQLTTEVALSQDDGGWRCTARVLTTRKGETIPAAKVKLRFGAMRPAPETSVIPARTPERHEVGDIKALLPHRYPMLLIDRVDALETADRLTGVKAVTANEPCYRGLAVSDDHAYPQVLMVESWCQAAGVLAVRDAPIPDVLTGKATLFGAIKQVTFHEAVKPGDVMTHHVSAQKILSDAAAFEGQTLVEGRPVMTVGQIVIALREASTI